MKKNREGLSPEIAAWLSEADLILRPAQMEQAAKMYAYLETEDKFLVAVDVYLNLQNLNESLGRKTEPMPELAPMVADYPEDLPKALADALVKLNEWHEEMNRQWMLDTGLKVYDKAVQEHGEDSEHVCAALAIVMEHLPKSTKERVNAKLREIGSIPKASGYTADGEPVFTVEDVAKHLNMEVKEVEQLASQFIQSMDASTIHRLQ